MRSLTRGEIAKRAQVNLETIRYYEREGLLSKPPRSSSGYRIFSQEDLRRVRFIKQAQALGFSLKEIKELLALRIDPESTCADIRERAAAKIVTLNEKPRTLQAMKQVLERLTVACPGQGALHNCPILESLDAEKETVP